VIPQNWSADMNLNLTTTARLGECLLLSYRTPARSVRHLVPRGLDLVTRGGFAFWNVAASRVEHLRPAALPQRFGVSYRHVAYRLHVEARTAGAGTSANSANTLRGLYFVRSDADSGVVGALGNLFTDFRFHPAEVELSSRDGVLTLAVQGKQEQPDPRDGEPRGDAGDCIVRVAEGIEAIAPPPGSPFASAEEAERVLKYPTLGLSVDLDGRYLHLAEVIRDEAAWSERPVRLIEAHFRFFEELGLGPDEVQLERATRVAPIDYRWRLGRRVALLAAPAAAPAQPAEAARAAA
jgi:hypothetical protein